MSRPNQVVAQFPALDHEPRGHGPPPSYRNSAATEDSWSTMSGSDRAMERDKRRSSWNNLVQVGGDPLVPKQAPPRPALPQVSTTFAAIGSRTSSEMGIPQTVYTTQFSAHGQAMPMQKVYSNEPRLVSVPRPAGTIHTSSVPGSRAGSVVMSMSNPSPPIIHKSNKSIDSKMSKKPKRNRLQDMKSFCCRPKVVGCSLCLLVALIVAIIIIIVLTQVLPSPKQATFNWVAPSALTNGQNVSSQIAMKVEKERIRFEMKGAAPMKGNFINYYDFNNNQAVVIDQSLLVNGKNLYCFIVPLDRQTMPNPGDVRKAAKNSVLRHQQTEGWQEQWTWIPAPVQQTNGNANMFNPIIPECNGSRIVQLQATSDQKNRRCTDCYDFCLPEYGVMRDATKNNEEYLNIVRRDCFYLFVPEWRTYAQANSIEQNQQDFENYYRNRQHMQVSYTGPNDSRWIPLSGMPRQMINATGNMMNQVGSAVSQFGSNIYGAVTGNQPQQQSNQQQQQQQMNHMANQQNLNQGYQNVPGNGNALPNGMLNQNNNVAQAPSGYISPNNVNQFVPNNPNQPQNFGNNPQPAGYHPAAVNGVVNLNGVNGMVGNSEYNTQQLGPQPAQQQAISPDMRRNAPYTFNSSPNSNSNINSGYTNPQSSISSGSSSPSMNGFGAQPSYQTSQFGFGGLQSNDPRNGGSQSYQGQNGNTNPTTPGGRIGTVLNEFGNPVNVQPAQSQMSYTNYQDSLGRAPLQSSYAQSLQLQQQLQQQQGQNMNQNPTQTSSSGGSGYRPDVQPTDYNIPNWNQPNRPDALSRPGRIFK